METLVKPRPPQNRAPHRNRLVSAQEILRYCLVPRVQTKIQGTCNFCTLLVKKYLADLTARGFLEQDQCYYQTTSYGREFLQGLDIVLEMWNSSAP